MQAKLLYHSFGVGPIQHHKSAGFHQVSSKMIRKRGGLVRRKSASVFKREHSNLRPGGRLGLCPSEGGTKRSEQHERQDSG